MDKVLSSIDRQFALLDRHSRELLEKITKENLFVKARAIANSMTAFSCGEYILRSAAVVEKTFGGITTRLWDDPFEWTLPENLSTAAKVIEYLEEVDATRQRAFASFARDADLLREIMLPSTETVPLIDLLIETLIKTAEYYGRAAATHSLLANIPAPRQ